MRLLVVGDFQGVLSRGLQRKLRREECDAIVGVGDYSGLKDWRPLVMHNLRAAQEGRELMSHEEYFGKKRLKALLTKEETATKKILRFLNSLGKPVFLIFGNGDDDWYRYPFQSLWSVDVKKQKFLRKLKNIRVMTYGTKKCQGETFVGFGGYLDIDAYFDRKAWKQEGTQTHARRVQRRERSRQKLFSMLRKTSGERIFVFHYPPQGVFDIIRDTNGNPMNGKSTGQRFFTEAIRRYKPRLVLCGHMPEYQGMKKLFGVPVVNPGDAEKGKYAVVEISDGGKVRGRFSH